MISNNMVDLLSLTMWTKSNNAVTRHVCWKCMELICPLILSHNNIISFLLQNLAVSISDIGLTNRTTISSQCCFLAVSTYFRPANRYDVTICVAVYMWIWPLALSDLGWLWLWTILCMGVLIWTIYVEICSRTWISPLVTLDYLNLHRILWPGGQYG